MVVDYVRYIGCALFRIGTQILTPHFAFRVLRLSDDVKNTATPVLVDDELIENEEAELTREQLLELREALIVRRKEVVQEYERHVREASEDTENLPDEMDIAERQSRHAYLFRLADKESKLIREIDRALAKFPSGAYC